MAIIRKCKSKIIDVQQPVLDTFVVTLEPVGKKIKFKPGQFLHLALDPYDPTKPWPDSRCFSIQSPPGDSLLKFTFSIKGKYTARMAKELAIGKEVYLKYAYGELFLKSHNKKKCVFIAGGTGITPYLSLLNCEDISDYENPRLYFGVREPSFHIYHNEFSRALRLNPSLKITVNDQTVDGILDIEKIIEENGIESDYFISGPPLMIKTFKDTLIAKQITLNQIRTDDWE